MNLSDLRSEVRRLLAEMSPPASYFSDDDITRFINEGIKDICLKAKVYVKVSQAIIVNNVATYTLPWDFIEVVSLTNPSGISLDPIEAKDVGKAYIVSGYPLYFYTAQTPLTYSIRQNTTSYSLGTFLVPATANGYMYEVTVAGTTGASPPTFPTTPGTSVTDGTATLTCREWMSRIYSLTLVDTPTSVAGGTGTYTLTYHAIDEGLYSDTDSPNFPFDKHHLLVLYACYRCALKAKDLTLASTFIADYAAGLGLPLASQASGKQPIEGG